MDSSPVLKVEIKVPHINKRARLKGPQDYLIESIERPHPTLSFSSS